MSDVERVLGELKEFKRQSIEAMKELRDEVKDLRKQVDELSSWRWKVAGMATLAAWAGGMLVEWFRKP